MAIISENNLGGRKYINTQIRYGLLYVCVTFVVLIFLNLYTSATCQKLFYQSKQSSMIEKCQLAAARIADIEVLNFTTVANAVEKMDSLKVNRLIITNQDGLSVYDSLSQNSSVGKYVLLPEIVDALEDNGNNVFTWDYHDGTMVSRAATPVYSYGSFIGCVYMLEFDIEQGALIQSLQHNVLTTTLVLEVLVIVFSIIFSKAYSQRFYSIFSSMRIIREGDYSHKVTMHGHDELAFLGEEFNALTQKLQTSENKRRQFVSDASHELKTPLSSIKLLTDSILQNDMDMETVREFVEDIGNEADRLNRMTLKLLSLSHVEGQQDGDCEIIYMAPTNEKVVRMLSGIAGNNKITIDTQLDDDCPILILEDDLYQIAFNLVENGIKYNTAGGNLKITLKREGDNAIMQVSDTGVGIPQDAIEHVFERFYRVDKARSRKSGGSGLGLAIVRSMVERNQGTISVESTVGVGTCFTVIFPAFDTEEDAQ